METLDQRPKTFKEITDAHIQEWKQKGHENLRQISVPLDEDDLDEENGARFVICSPSRPVLNSATKYSSDKDFERANKVLLKNCVLGGDMEALTDIKIELAVLEKIGKTLEAKNVKVKKL